MGLLSDISLTARVKTALIADERIGASGINVDTKDGVVTLRGAVPSEPLRDRAQGIALECGASQVVNALGLEDRSCDPPRAVIPPDFGRVVAQPGESATARLSLKDAVRAAFVADRRVNEHLLIPRVSEGVVFLTGRQDTVDAREAAAEVAARVPGVVDVVNDIEVMPSV